MLVMDLGCLYCPFTCEENIHSLATYFDCSDNFDDFLWTVHSKDQRVDLVDVSRACVDFAVITF